MAIITQAQFDAIDFSQRSLDLKLVEKRVETQLVFIKISYNTLELLANGSWQTTQKTDNFTFDFKEYKRLRDTGLTKNQAIADLKQDILAQAAKLISSQRAFLESQKTKAFSSELNANDISITNDELNNVNVVEP